MDGPTVYADLILIDQGSTEPVVLERSRLVLIADVAKRISQAQAKALSGLLPFPTEKRNTSAVRRVRERPRAG